MFLNDVMRFPHAHVGVICAERTASCLMFISAD